MDVDADLSSSLWNSEAVLSKFFPASEAENLNPPSKIAFLDPVPSSVNEASIYSSLMIHQAYLAAPTHEAFCLLCRVQRDLLVPPPVKKIWTAAYRDRGEG